MHYFAACTLHSKARRDWALASAAADNASTAEDAAAAVARASQAGALSAQEQGQLMGALLQELKVLCGVDPAAAAASGGGAQSTPLTSAAVLSKLALALSVMASRTPQGPADLIASLSALASAAFPSPSSLVLLEILAALAEEVTRAKMSYVRAEDVKAQLRRQADGVAASIAAYLREASALDKAQRRSPDLDLQVSKCLAVLLGWREYGLDLGVLHSTGILNSLAELAVGWLNHDLSQSAHSASRLQLLQQFVEVAEAAFDLQPYPRPTHRNQAVDLVLALLVQAAKPVYDRTVAECVSRRSATALSPDASALLDRADALCLLICRLSSSLCTDGEIAYLACFPCDDSIDGPDSFPTLTPGGSNYLGGDRRAAQPPNPLHAAYWELHLSFTAHPYHRGIVEASLDVWSMLQDQPVAERKFPALKGEMFVRVLAALVGASAYPAGFRGWHTPLLPTASAASAASPDASAAAASSYFVSHFLDDPDAFLRFRGLLLEVYLSIFAILGDHFVSTLTQAALDPAATWTRVEAVLSALEAVHPELNDSFHEASVSLDRKRALHGQLAGVLGKIWSLASFLPPAGMSPAEINATLAAQAANPGGAVAPLALMQTASGFMAHYAFLFEYASGPAALEMMQRSVQFLIGCAAASPAGTSSSGKLKRNHSGSSNVGSESFMDVLAGLDCIAGRSFAALCRCPSSTPPTLLISSPALLGEVLRLLFKTPGFSERISAANKAEFMHGLSALVVRIAYSSEAAAALERAVHGRELQPAVPAASASSSSPLPPVDPACADYTVAKASAYLVEMTTPLLSGVSNVFAHLAAQQAKNPGVTYASPPAEAEAVKHELSLWISLLLSVLEPIAMPPATWSGVARMYQNRSRLHDALAPVPAGTPGVPPSLAMSVYSAAWPLLQQSSAFLLPQRDEHTLGLIVRVYATAIQALYPHELMPMLPTLVQSGLTLYTSLPLPSVLDLLTTAVSESNYGAHPELRDLWNHALTHVWRYTLLNTKESFKSSSDVFASFFPLMTAMYEHATYCFLANPANTLPHILQFCVQILDALAQQRDLMQKVLYFLERLLGSTVPIDCLPERAELHALFTTVYTEQGSGLLRQLCSNLTEALPPLLEHKIAGVLRASYERAPEQTKHWIERAIESEYIGNSVPHLNETHKSLFLSVLWSQSSNARVWKSVWIEWSKVCQGDENMDSILAFQMQASGKMKGSDMQNRAFEGL